jgi:hypothetical protein
VIKKELKKEFKTGMTVTSVIVITTATGRARGGAIEEIITVTGIITHRIIITSKEMIIATGEQIAGK